MNNVSVLCLLLCLLLLCLQSRSEDANTTNNSTSSCEVSSDMETAPTIRIDKSICVALWTTVAVVSVLCNVLIIHVVRVNPHMRTTTNYLIVNMAFGDLYETFVSTFGNMHYLEMGTERKEDNLFAKYITCKAVFYLFFVSMLCSIFSLVVITFDRFLAVTRPLKYKNHSSWAKYIIPVIWVASLAIPANYAFTKVDLCHKEGKTHCIAKESPFDAILIVSLGFVLPHVVIVILYMVIAYKLCTRRVPGERAQEDNGQTAAQQVARKVTRLIICILVAFEVSWGPVFLGYVLPFLYFGKFSDNYIELYGYKLLMISNGISNALIYAVFNENFRRAFKETLRWKPFMSALRNIQNRLKNNTVNSGNNASNQDKTSTTGIPTV